MTIPARLPQADELAGARSDEVFATAMPRCSNAARTNRLFKPISIPAPAFGSPDSSATLNAPGQNPQSIRRSLQAGPRIVLGHSGADTQIQADPTSLADATVALFS
ncbi:hypothetical protein ACGF8B_19760 [Streptomyces sp. NPDC047917]|uniref:hypothetical protein n=1 Tax=Streptomyces sp. NPDC047917 TaxID=3365491 RepID=UPI0037139E3C